MCRYCRTRTKGYGQGRGSEYLAGSGRGGVPPARRELAARAGTAGFGRLGCGGRAPQRSEECLIDVRAPPAPALLDLEQRCRMTQRRTVASSRGKRVVDIDDADDLGVDRNLVALQPVGVTGAVVPLVVPADDRFDVPGKLHRGQ